MVLDYLFGYDVFISYKHTDSDQYAKTLSEALQKRDYRVFIDTSELPPGETLSPGLEAAIKRSKAMVVIGTINALHSKYVSLEVSHCLQLERKLIPVSIGNALHNTTWPGTADLVTVAETTQAHQAGSPSDEVISAITRSLTFTKRNKIRRRVLLVVSLLLVVLAGGVAWTSVRWIQTVAAAKRSDIDAELKADSLRPKNSTDLSRAALLVKLLAEAEQINYQGAITRIKVLLSKIPGPQARQDFLPPDSTRSHLVFDRTGRNMAIAYSTRIDVIDRRSESCRARYDLDSLLGRMPGKLLWIDYDPAADTYLFELEYEAFASLQEAAEENNNPMSDGILGKEREIFSLTSDGKKLNCLGYSQKLSLETVEVPPDNEDAISIYVINPSDAQVTRSTAFIRTPDRSAELLGKLGPTVDTMRVIASAGGSAIYEVKVIISEVKDITRQFEIYPLFLDSAGHSITLETQGSYPHRSITRMGSNQAPPYLDAVLEPAILNANRKVCLLRQLYIDFSDPTSIQASKLSLNYDVIENVQFTSNHKDLIIRFKDGTIGRFNIAANRLTHRFPSVGSIRKTLISPDGNDVFVLHDDGRIVQWNFSVFSPDTWSNHSNFSRQKPDVQKQGNQPR